MKTALIVVDYQQDFRRGGALGAEKSEEIRQPLLDLIQEVDVVVASRDWHPEDHVSFSDKPEMKDGSWPVHCVQETLGAEIDPEIAKYADAVVSKGTDPKKEAYSAFQGKVDGQKGKLADLSNWLEKQGIEHVIVGGLVDEYCVQATALDALSEGFLVTVNINTAAALTDAGESATLSDLDEAGVRISNRKPRGDRVPTRDEALLDLQDAVLTQAEAAEREQDDRLSAWYGTLLREVQAYADDCPQSSFTVTIPDFTLSGVEFVFVPEAPMTSE